MKKSVGNVGDIMITGMCTLAMTVVMLFYMDSVQLIQTKTEVSQLARKYILRMETMGYLTAQDRVILTNELQDIGVTDISYEGTTLNEVMYGMPIKLQIQGKLKEEYLLSEQRVSTSKN